MAKTSDAKQRAARKLSDENPNADAEQALEALEALEQLVRMGRPRSTYNLDSPYGHRTSERREKDDSGGAW